MFMSRAMTAAGVCVCVCVCVRERERERERERAFNISKMCRVTRMHVQACKHIRVNIIIPT